MENFWKRSAPAGPEMEPISPKEDVDSAENLKDKISKRVKGGASKAKKKTKHLAGKVKAAFSHGSSSQSGDSSHDSGDEVDPRAEEENFSDSHTSAPATTPRSELNYNSVPSSPSVASPAAALKNSGPLYQDLTGVIEPLRREEYESIGASNIEDASLWQRTKEQFSDSPSKTSGGDENSPHSGAVTPGGYVISGSSPDKEKELVVVLSSSVFDSKGEEGNADANVDASIKAGQEEEIEVESMGPAKAVQGTPEELEEPVVLVVPVAATHPTVKEIEEEPVAPVTPRPMTLGKIEEQPQPPSAPVQVEPVSILSREEFACTSPASIFQKAVKDAGFFDDQSGKSVMQWAYDTTKAPFSILASTLIDTADHPEVAGVVASNSSTLVIWAYDTTAATFNWFVSPFGTVLPRSHKKPWRTSV